MANEIVTMRDLVIILETYFSPALAAHEAIYLLATIYSFYLLFRLHRNQPRDPGRSRFTAWRKVTLPLLEAASEEHVEGPGQNSPPANHVLALYHDIEDVATFLGLNTGNATPIPFVQHPKPILVTRRLNCLFCAADTERR